MPTPAPGVPSTPTSHLPATRPGTGPEEGVFLVTTADDGSRATYFIAGNTRHSVLAVDMQLELQLNPLWPVHTVGPDEVLAFPEGAPIGAARTDLLSGSAAAAEPAAEEEQLAPEPVPEEQPVADRDEQPVANDAQQPVADTDAETTAATTYTVRPGDSAIRIARQFGISPSALLAANGIVNPNRVYVGQVLLIPGS